MTLLKISLSLVEGWIVAFFSLTCFFLALTFILKTSGWVASNFSLQYQPLIWAQFQLPYCPIKFSRVLLLHLKGSVSKIGFCLCSYFGTYHRVSCIVVIWSSVLQIVNSSSVSTYLVFDSVILYKDSVVIHLYNIKHSLDNYTCSIIFLGMKVHIKNVAWHSWAQ